MRKLIVTNIVSLDGYHEAPNGDILALPMDHAFDAYNAERLRAAGILLLGATSYGLFQGFWPTLQDDPAARPVIREISRLNNAIAKVVVSDRLEPDPAAPWHATTRILRRREAHGALAELKTEPGADILLFGSRTLWNDLFAAGLIDELHLMVGAVVLGAGTPAFVRPPVARLELLGTRTWEGSSNVLLRYACAR